MNRLPLLSAKQLSKRFGTGHTAVNAVNNIDLDIFPGELVLIMGPSGSGKTTLLSMLGGLLKPSEGQICIEDVDIAQLNESQLPVIRAQKIGFVFQSFNLLDALSVEQNILFPARLAPGGVNEAKPRARQLIDRLGLTKRQHALPRTLSGGEKQRVAIARALINQPALILADEPTGNLDSKSGQEVMMTLFDIARDDGCAVLIVTHDPRVEEISDRILWLEDGSIRDRKSEHHQWVIDPVCGMRLDEWTSQIDYIHNGRKHHFCSQRCRQRFIQEPEIYSKTNTVPLL